MTYFELEREIAWHFSYILDLAERLEVTLASDFKNARDEYEQLSDGYDRTIIDAAYGDGYTIKKDFDRLWIEDPERAQSVQLQMSKEIALISPKMRMHQTGIASPHITWAAILVITLSHLESSLKRICNHHAEAKDDSAWLARTTTYLADYEKYLSEHTRFCFSSSSRWKDIRFHFEVRNQLVHSGGFLDGLTRSDSIRKYSDVNAEELYINSKCVVSIKPKYVKRIIEQSWDFILELPGKP